MGYKFVYTRPENFGSYDAVSRVEFEVDDGRTVDEMLQAFKGLLLATGYYLKGDIVIEESEEQRVTTEDS